MHTESGGKKGAVTRVTGAAAGAGALAGLSIARAAHAAGSDLIRIGLVGCGGRGTGAAHNALSTDQNVRLVAMGDAFAARLEGSLRSLAAQHGEASDKIDVPADRQFVGLDCCRRVAECDVDAVLVCSPPGFRPLEFETVIEAGRHAFLEKPICVDAPGYRRVLATNAKAKEKGLAVAVGHHLRHERKHIEPIALVHDGAIGEVRCLRVYFNSSGVWVRPRQPGQSEMEHQVSNWYYFNWLSGDHIVEQHVHDLDVANWIMQGPPQKANGMGGRQVRIGPEYGEIFDHHSVEFEYSGGVRCYSFCRHIPNTWESFSEHAHGTAGSLDIQGHGSSELRADGQEPRRWSRDTIGHQVEMDRLFAAIAEGTPHNEGQYGAEASMTAILGRMATYSGQEVTWEEAVASELDLTPEGGYTWDADPQPEPGPDGIYPCAIPGVTRAV